MLNRARAKLAIALMLSGAASAHGYNLFGPYPWGPDQTYYNKWGDFFHAGTPGGTITWSLIPDGTAIDGSLIGQPDSDFNASTCSLEGLMTGLGYSQALAAIQRGFDHWSAAANIYFQQVSDAGLTFGSIPGNDSPTVGRIRIGAYSIKGNSGAFGFAAPPNGGRVEGDILFNADNLFQFAAGDEGEPNNFLVGGIFHNDFEGLFLHELGHALGIDHSDVCAVMSADTDCFLQINRLLDPDDVAAVRFLYGSALAADFDHDNRVDADDLSLWEAGFDGPPPIGGEDGDANGDGRVDGADFLVWQREVGLGSAASTGASAGVPEPATLQLGACVLVLALALLRRRLAAAIAKSVRGTCRTSGTWRTTWERFRRIGI